MNSDMADLIADVLVEDYVALMLENERLRNKIEELESKLNEEET